MNIIEKARFCVKSNDEGNSPAGARFYFYEPSQLKDMALNYDSSAETTHESQKAILYHYDIIKGLLAFIDRNVEIIPDDYVPQEGDMVSGKYGIDIVYAVNPKEDGHVMMNDAGEIQPLYWRKTIQLANGKHAIYEGDVG